MGANGSSARNVSFGLDDDKKVTVIEGVRLSGDVCRRMREAQASGKPKPPSVPPEGQKPGAHPEGVSTKEAQEEMRKNFEHQQALVQEQLAKLAQKEKEVSAATGLKDSSAAAIMERGRAHHEQEKAKVLVGFPFCSVFYPCCVHWQQHGWELDEHAPPPRPAPSHALWSTQQAVCARAKQLERKEAELATLSAFYKEQLEILEKKEELRSSGKLYGYRRMPAKCVQHGLHNLDEYKQAAEEYNQAASRAEAHLRPRRTEAFCTDLQAKVLQCYRENPQQTLLCSSLAKQYMSCVHQAKSSLTNHG
uniref:Coiled-coil-helix-coiled-coil-helix domain containing 6b n=1 Tax=Oryzias latipes TaxID=8090 RepID=A0A3B3HLD9_ORYLA